MTADALDAAVLRRCFWPSTNAPLSQTERLAVANEEILGTLYPKVIAARASYYLTTLDQALTAGQELYRLPAHAYGPLKDIVTVDDAGNEHSVDLIGADELGHGYGSASVGGVHGLAMYFRGDFIGLRPVPAMTLGTLRVRYYRQPSPLCLAATARELLGFNGTTIFQCTDGDDVFPAGPTMLICVLSGGNAHQTLIEDLVVTASDSAFVTVSTSAAGYGISAKDWISITGTSPLVQLPDFMLSAAVRKIAAACLQAAGDIRASGEHDKADKLIELAFSTAIPRVEGEPRVTRTSGSPFRLR